jgi:hypothetical protein
VLTAGQRTEFDELGFVRLRDVFSDDEAADMRRVVWDELETRYGIVEDDRSTWNVPVLTGMKTTKKHAAFRPIGGPSLRDALDELLGAGRCAFPTNWGQVLVTFPQPGAEWKVPATLWHVDWFYANAPTPVLGVKALAFFGDVVPQGGGTLVVSGSHRVAERFLAETTLDACGDFRACRLEFMTYIQRDPWFRALTQTDDPDPHRNGRFMDSDHDADGLPVRVVELTGSPGDVVLMHPWVLHHAAPNTASYPRMMRGKNLHRAG